MRTLTVSLLLFLCTAAVVDGQAIPAGGRFNTPRGDVSVGFQHVDANAPPGICNCFGINGFYVSGDYTVLRPWLSIAGTFSRGHGNDISNLGQNLTLMTYMAGPKVSFAHRRFNPYAQALFGGAHGSDSYFPTGTTYTTSANSFAVQPGVGLDINVGGHFAVRAIEASYLHTQFPNGTTNSQNQLTLNAGVVFKWGSYSPGSKARPTPPVPEPQLPPPPPQTFSFACSASGNMFNPGDAVHITTTASRDGSPVPVFYAWRTSGGQVAGSGDNITIDTKGLTDGAYTVNGTASLTSDRTVTQQCEVSFRVSAPAPPPPAAVVPPPPTPEQRQKSFRDNIKDIYFDVAKSELRPDQFPNLDKDATFLVQNPDMYIQIGGFADQRGSSAYNLALGERRANAVRDRLIAHGVKADRIQIVTFGRDAQACTANNESCWKQNRRVGFVLQP